MVHTKESPEPAQIAKQTVLIATDNRHESNFIAESLEGKGYAVKFCIYDGESLKGTPVKAPDAVLFVFSDFIEACPIIINSLKRHFEPKTIPYIGALTRHGNFDHSAFDSVIYPPAHISQIANRVSSMIRLGQMDREIQRRVTTLSEDFEIDYALSEIKLIKPFRVLFIGKASPEFMVIINALQKKNVQVVAAFTSFSAFDYLHENKFNAVVMNALKQSEPALTISETMRRNAKLYHIPTLFLVDAETFDDMDIAYQKGAHDIISTRAETEEISGRILELANYHRIHEQLKDEFNSVGGETCLDAQSGVFNKKFFKAHIKRVNAALKKAQEPLAFIAVKALPNARLSIPENKMDEAMDQIGQMLKGLVRMQDVTARLSYDSYVIAFPEHNANSVESILERINSIVDCAAFDSGSENNSPFTMTLETSIFELLPHDDGEDIIEITLSELEGTMTSKTSALIDSKVG